MKHPILLSPPDTGIDEEEAVRRALRSGWVAPLGPEVDAFEREMATFTRRSHAVALASGTAALHLALLNWGIGRDNVVITATMTFAATANAITYTGAEPVFIDCDQTGNIDVDLLDHALANLQHRRKKVAAIIPVDLLGKIADYDAIERLERAVGIPTIADSAESLGASRNGRPAGSFGHAAALSFNGNKVMTTSGGGMLLTDDAELASRTRYLATQARQPVLHYEHTDIGYNYRLSNILAAIGRSQLARLGAMIEQRRRHRVRYRDFFAEVPGVTIFGAPDGADGDHNNRDNSWLTSIKVDPEVTGWTSHELIDFLAAHNIEARPLWKPMHLPPVFQHCESYTNGTSEVLFRTGLSLPSGSGLSDDDFARILETLRTFLVKHGGSD